MRIKIIGDNNCARATRHLLRKAGFAVSEFLPAEVITQAPHSGYAITIDLAPAPSPSGRTLGVNPDPTHKPDHSTHGHPSANKEEAFPFAEARAGASSPSFAKATEGRPPFAKDTADGPALAEATPSRPAPSRGAAIHFDSVDSELEAAVLRHVAQLAVVPVVVDRPGGIVHSERELRIVVPHTEDARADEAAAVAVEFGVLRGLLDLTAPPLPKAAPVSRSGGGKKWWPFSVVLLAGALFGLAGNLHALPRHVVERRGAEGAYLHLEAALPEPQGQFATGQAVKIFDGTNTLVVDPCQAQTKLFVSINQTANAQLVAGTASKKIYICSIHVVVAAATNVALVEGTGAVCATGTAGVSGFGGATAATGWNFMANGGIALGNGNASVGAEGTNADNLCLFNSGSGQVSGGISYVVQ
jgi:hypothetical protein